MGRLAGALALVLLTACSGAGDEPLVEYPTPSVGAGPSDPSPSPSPPSGNTTSPKAPPSQPIVGEKILGGPVFLRGLTSDGHLVLESGPDLVVLPSGSTAPVTVVKDYRPGFDSTLVRGRFVAAWLGDSPLPSSMTMWSGSSGLLTDGPVAMREAFHPSPDSDRFAYRAPAASALSSNVRVTRPGEGTGTLIAEGLDNGVVDSKCRPSIGWLGSDLLIAGCTGGSTTPTIVRYATDGSGATTTILANAARGLWVDHARTRAIVQTSTAAEIRSLHDGGAPPVSLDTPVRQALFSADDACVVYVRADGTLRRASTASPASPVDLATGVVAILGTSPDARFTAYATKSDPSTKRTDVILVDATAPSAKMTLAADNAIFHGFSKDGSALVYQTTSGTLARGPLVVKPTSGGDAVTISDDAQRVVFDGGVVYWQKLVVATKTHTLDAARVSAPSVAVRIDQDLDAVTSHVMVGSGKLFVGSKLGLFSYPSLGP